MDGREHKGRERWMGRGRGKGDLDEDKRSGDKRVMVGRVSRCVSEEWEGKETRLTH